MYQSFGEVTLRSGEKVEAGVVIGPDADWQGRVLHLLAHKPPIWQWQMEQLLTHNLGAEARIHLLHRDGVPFSHILTIEHNGVGLLGHVWTVPEDRGQTAASLLMGKQLADFHARGGKAMYLSTGFDTSPYRIYSKHGYMSVEPGSGVMALFTESRERFEADYFAPAEGIIEPFGWSDYATASALFTSGVPGFARCVPIHLFGRNLTEGPVLPALQKNETEGAARAVALRLANGAVAGMSAWSEHSWPKTNLVDVFCHPNFWQKGTELLRSLKTIDCDRTVAYVEAGFAAKRAAFEGAGFEEIARLPGWLPEGEGGEKDVLVYSK